MAGPCGNTTIAGNEDRLALTTGPSPTFVCAWLSLPFSTEPCMNTMTGMGPLVVL